MSESGSVLVSAEGLIGDDLTASKLLEVADDLDSWASRLEWDSERHSAV